MESNIEKSEKKASSRRSPRNHSAKPSQALLTAKNAMKQRSMNVKCADFIKDDYAIAQISKNHVRGKTGIVFDDLNLRHYCLWDSNYPECPERYTSVMARIKEMGLLEKCLVIESREGTPEEILKKHTIETIEILKQTIDVNDQDKLEDLSANYDALFITNDSYKSALLSVGSTIDLVDAVVKGVVQNGMGIIRPPGHHAMAGEYCGYCFYNNVALAASHALDAGVNRILIVDWDVHHGQGTQQMFYNDPRVLYFSIHRYENGSFWPNLRQSDYDYVGEGAGKGFNINVPLNATGMADADYITIFQKILLPVAYEYLPELILVSAGYDAAIGCPEGEMEVTPACYAHLTSSLMGLAGGKVAIILEGGYCLKSLSEGAALTLRALQGAPSPSLLEYGSPNSTIISTILDVISAHRPYWQCLQLEELSDVNTKDDDTHTPKILYLGDDTKPEKYATRNCYPVQSEEFLSKVDTRLNSLKLLTKLVKGPRVGLVTDDSMLRHANVAESDHPEKPERLRSVLSKHREYGLLDRCIAIKPRIATEEELALVHNAEHIAEMKATVNKTQAELDEIADKFDSVYLNKNSYECACLSAGSVLEMVDQVVTGEVNSGVAVVRPPGHHAEEDAACGFCLFNNVALAAKYSLDIHGLQRVLLIDWDVHHGNGTQRMFEEDPRVLYISLHRYNHARFFPASTDANYDKVGIGKGAGFNINIPWNKSGGGMTDGDYIAAFHSIVLPVAYQFQPQLVLVSAGFDACVNDPLGHCKVTPEAYAHMTHWLLPLANGRVVLALEGGYNVTSISYAMTLCTKALLGDPLPPLTAAPTVPSLSAVETIRNVISVHQPFWSSLAFSKKIAYPPSHLPKLTKAEKDFVNDKLSSLKEGVKTMAVNDNSAGGDASEGPSAGSSSSGNKEPSGRTEQTPTLKEILQDNLELLSNEEVFAVAPLTSCPHLDQVAAVPASGINHSDACATCQGNRENWTCLSCYTVQCGRHVNGHMMEHAEEAVHPLTLSFSDLSVWCYACEAYIDNMILYSARNALHKSKFGVDLVWSYGPGKQ